MKKILFILTMSMIIGMVDFNHVFAANIQPGPEICGTDDYMSINDGEYFIWNFNSGSQCTRSTGGTSWTISSNSTTGASGSMPLIFKGCHWGTWCTNNSNMPMQISNIESATSSWSISGTNVSGNWNASYDCWISKNGGTAPDGVELMIWFSWEGTHRPAGSVIADNINISGVMWELWQSQFTSWVYIGYRAKNQITSANLDIKAFIQDLINRGICQSSWWLDNIEAGFEIEDTGAVGLTTDSFSASVIAGGGTVTNPPTETVTPTATPTTAPGGLRGDVNSSGTIDIVDALLVAQYYVGLHPSGFVSANADVTNDGSIDIVDALRIAQCYVGLISCDF
jgi:hypothetical protein